MSVGSSASGLATQALELVGVAEPAAEVEVSISRNRLALTRFANSVIHQNVAEDTPRRHVTIHRDGRTVSGSSTVADESGLQALVDRTVAAARVAPLDPGWPGLAPPAPVGPVAPLDPATAGRHAGRPGGHRQGVRRRRRRAGDRRVLPDQPLDGRVRQLGRTGRRGGERRRRPGRHRPAAGERRRRSGGVGTAGRHRRCRARRPRRGEGQRRGRPGRVAARPLRGRARADGRRRHPRGVHGVRLQRQGRRRAALVRAPRRRAVRRGRHARRRRAGAGLGYDAEGTPRQRLVLVDGGTTVALTHDRRTAADGRRDVDRARRRVGGVRRRRPAPRPARRRRAAAPSPPRSMARSSTRRPPSWSPASSEVCS